ncbi:MAG: radical SAM protein, partial [Clostridiales bacterium]|jgi:tRNA A37 methylthiotransferase MiaB|nr:radical SAM protein [Clostridiales bacterium]
VNQYESGAMLELFRQRGAFGALDGEPPDAVVVNTCAVTGESERKSRQMIRRMRRRYPGAVLAVAGCFSQNDMGAAAGIGGVDVVFGAKGRRGLVDAVMLALAERAAPADSLESRGGLGMRPHSASGDGHRAAGEPYEELGVTPLTERVRAYVKIQDGCDQFCSYCIVPHVRGRARSRDAGGILREVSALAAAGCREIVLTGIHISSYGKDFPRGGVRQSGGGAAPASAGMSGSHSASSRHAISSMGGAAGLASATAPDSMSASPSATAQDSLPTSPGASDWRGISSLGELVCAIAEIASGNGDGAGDSKNGCGRLFVRPDSHPCAPVRENTHMPDGAPEIGCAPASGQAPNSACAPAFACAPASCAMFAPGLSTEPHSAPRERRTPRFRLRLSSLEPSAVTDELACAIGAHRDVVCPHFHLSLQSGSASVLKRMSRRYTPEVFRRSVALLRGVFPDAAITTDVIVGFPGETDDEFAQCLDFCREMAFSGIHAFKFSPRPGTPAAGMDGQVGAEAKSAHSKQLISLASEMSLAYYRKFVGKSVNVLVESVSENSFEGLAPNYARVRAATPACAMATGGAQAGAGSPAVAAVPGTAGSPMDAGASTAAGGTQAEIGAVAGNAPAEAGALAATAEQAARLPQCGELADVLVTSADSGGLAGVWRFA